MKTPGLIPVQRPLLPHADRLLPYLRRIDATRTYSNWGPLADDLERRLEVHFGLPEHGVVSASSGTAALVGAVLGIAGRAASARPLALIPAYTFVATALAVELCGYRPYLVDVDPRTWLLDPAALRNRAGLDLVGLVVPVASFGRPVPQDPWIAFRRETGIPVAIDGGASFEGAAGEPRRFLGDIPTAFSFHATKSFGTGEGGCIATTDALASKRITQALNFGFYEARDCESPSTNGKMSEYHAAVGLAELEGWTAKRDALQSVAEHYRVRLARAGLGDRFVGAPDVAGCYALFHSADAAEARHVRGALDRSRVEYRLWYGQGLLSQAYFSDLPHDALDVTGELAPRIIGLPVAPDLSPEAIDTVVSALRAGVGQGR
jgi:dTDP-4-amino-4,6-dideoxygalactose transaminase